jgi:citrate lyase subunit beta / citryl-CoA lyase
MKINKKPLLLRSLLFVPGHNKKLLENAAKSDADALILDLEDSVLPKKNKKIAREIIIEKVKLGIFKKFKIFIRVNELKSDFFLDDIRDLTMEGVDGFMIPKVFSKKEIILMSKYLDKIEKGKKIYNKKFKIIPLIETASSITNLENICKASPRIIAIAFGSEDFICDIVGVHDTDEKSILLPRAFIVITARTHGIIPIDTVHTRIHDLKDLKKSITLAKVLGFEGKLALHPKEIKIINNYFSPSEKEIKQAHEILDLTKKARERSQGVAIINKRFIGPPIVKSAEKLLNKYKLIKNKNG